MLGDVDLLAVHQAGLELLGQDAHGGESPNQLHSRFTHALGPALVGHDLGGDVAVAPGNHAAAVHVREQLTAVRDP